MANPELGVVVRSYLAQGYSAGQIRQSLLAQGWQSHAVDGAIAGNAVDEAIAGNVGLPAGLPAGSPERSEKESAGFPFGQAISDVPASAKRWGIVSAIALVVITIVVIAAVVLLPKPSTQLLDVSLHPIATDVDAGSPLDFIVELVNLGSAKRFDLTIKSELVSVMTNEVVAAKTDTAAIETRNAVRTQILIPKDAVPGRYVVRTIVEYDHQSARASFSLKVRQGIFGEHLSAPPGSSTYSTPSATPECQGGCNDYDPCTMDFCVKGSCINQKITPCCGNRKCELSESPVVCPDDCVPSSPTREESVGSIKSRALDAAGSDVPVAVRLCKTLPVSSEYDACLFDVAKRSGQPEVCSQVVAEREKDGCLLDIALARDRFDLCDKVVDRWLKSSCFSYANLKARGR